MVRRSVYAGFIDLFKQPILAANYQVAIRLLILINNLISALMFILCCRNIDISFVTVFKFSHSPVIVKYT